MENMAKETPMIHREDYDGCQIALMEIQAGNEDNEWVVAAKNIWGEDTKVWEAVVGAWETVVADAEIQFGTDPSDIVTIQLGQDEDGNPRYRFLTAHDVAQHMLKNIFGIDPDEIH